MRTRSRVGVPKWRCDSDWRLFPLLRLVVASFVLLNCAFQSTVFTRPIQRPKGNAVIVGVVFVAPREAPKPTVDNTQTSSALVEQFKNEQVFGKQIDIAKAIVSKHDASDQGIPGAASDGRYRFERQIAADRYYAAHLLGDLRDPRGVALLVRLLDDPETQSIVPLVARTNRRQARNPASDRRARRRRSVKARAGDLRARGAARKGSGSASPDVGE